jgi:HK97 family phage prohead protease
MMALQGRALKFNEIIPLHRGENKLILSSAFDATLESGHAVKLLFGDHNGPCVGSTDDNLELYRNDDALFFRFTFPDTELGRKGRTIAESKKPTTLSVGFEYNRAVKSMQKYRGLDVMVVSHAWLYEISWLTTQRGADEHAFASYENIDGTSLEEDCQSGKLMVDGAAVNMRRALQRLSRVL